MRQSGRILLYGDAWAYTNNRSRSSCFYEDDMIHIFDTETTGLKAPGVVEIAWLEVDYDLNILGEFRSLVNPEKLIEPGAQAVHGITQEMVEFSPTMDEISAKLCKKIAVGVAHNLQFDKRVVKPWVTVEQGLCTLALARKFITTTTNHKLETLQSELGLPNRDSHTALGDVYTVRDLLVYMQQNFGLDLKLELARASSPKVIHKMPFGKHKGKSLMSLPKDYRAWLLGQEIDDNLRFSLNQLKEA